MGGADMDICINTLYGEETGDWMTLVIIGATILVVYILIRLGKSM